MAIDSRGPRRQPSRSPRHAPALCIAAGVVAALLGGGAKAQVASRIICYPSPCAIEPTNANTAISAGFAQFDLGTKFLTFLASQGGAAWQGAPNAGGGGADAPATGAPAYRAWGETYGMQTHSGAQADFAGDTRRAIGGVAGLGMMVAPGAMIGMSVDHSRTNIDVTNLPQHATLHLTQIGLNGVYETGPWTLSAAGVYGFGNVDSDRATSLGPAIASYDARLFGTVAEVSCYRGFGTSRIVPKLGLDWVRTETAAFTEAGGLDPTIVPTQVAQRARVYGGAEIGNTWIMQQRMLDLSAYGRVVDIYWRDVPTVLLASTNPIFSPQTVQGAMESRFGFDTGAMASYRFARNARIYAGYDGRFRNGYQSHSGTLGLDVRW